MSILSILLKSRNVSEWHLCRGPWPAGRALCRYDTIGVNALCRISALCVGGGRLGWPGAGLQRQEETPKPACRRRAPPHFPERPAAPPAAPRAERQSMRWNQFHLLMAGKAPMPEPGFAQALYYQVSGDADSRPASCRLGAGQPAPICANSRWSSTGARIFSPKRNRKPWPQSSRAASSKAAATLRYPPCGPALLAAVALSGHLPDRPGTGDRPDPTQVVAGRDLYRHQWRPRSRSRATTLTH